MKKVIVLSILYALSDAAYSMDLSSEVKMSIEHEEQQKNVLQENTILAFMKQNNNSFSNQKKSPFSSLSHIEKPSENSAEEDAPTKAKSSERSQAQTAASSRSQYYFHSSARQCSLYNAVRNKNFSTQEEILEQVEATYQHEVQLKEAHERFTALAKKVIADRSLIEKSVVQTYARFFPEDVPSRSKIESMTNAYIKKSVQKIYYNCFSTLYADYVLEEHATHATEQFLADNKSQKTCCCVIQ